MSSGTSLNARIARAAWQLDQQRALLHQHHNQVHHRLRHLVFKTPLAAVGLSLLLLAWYRLRR